MAAWTSRSSRSNALYLASAVLKALEKKANCCHFFSNALLKYGSDTYITGVGGESDGGVASGWTGLVGLVAWHRSDLVLWNAFSTKYVHLTLSFFLAPAVVLKE